MSAPGVKKETLTHGEYITLAGLLKIASEHQRSLDNMVYLISEIIEEDDKDYPGWAWEAITEGYDVDQFLRRLQITIKETDTNDV